MSGRKTDLVVVRGRGWVTTHMLFTFKHSVYNITIQLIIKHRAPSLPIVCFYKYNNFPSNKVHTFYFVWVYDINIVYINISMK